MRPIHIIGVPLDLGAGRRGVDMGPSAFRIAGLSEQIAALGYTVADKGDLPAPIPETQTPRDSQRKYAREIAKVCTKLYQTALESLVEGAMPLVLGRRSQPRRGIGRGGRRVGEADARAADRPPLDRRARRHEHAGDVAERQRARHAAGGAPRPGAERAGADRRMVAEGAGPSTPSSSAFATSTSVRRSRSATRTCTSSR